MPGARDSLQRAQRERQIAADRGDLETVRMLDRAIADLAAAVDREQPTRPCEAKGCGS